MYHTLISYNKTTKTCTTVPINIVWRLYKGVNPISWVTRDTPDALFIPAVQSYWLHQLTKRGRFVAGRRRDVDEIRCLSELKDNLALLCLV